VSDREEVGIRGFRAGQFGGGVEGSFSEGLAGRDFLRGAMFVTRWALWNVCVVQDLFVFSKSRYSTLLENVANDLIRQGCCSGPVANIVDDTANLQ